MGYLNLDAHEVKFAGSGAKLQWGLAIGVVVDKIIGVKEDITEENLLSGIRTELGNRGTTKAVADPSRVSAEEKKAIDGLLTGSGTKLTTHDLHKVFSELH